MTQPSVVHDTRTDTLGGLVFVLLWSSGYIAVGVALKTSEPFTFAALRFLGTVLLIGSWLALRRPSAAAPPGSLRHAALAGLLLQAGFFGFTYVGVRAGAPVSAAGLICGLMPLVTAVVAKLALDEPMHRGALVGLALGLAGVLLVVVPHVRGTGTGLGYACLALALLSLSGGTVYQKRFVTGMDSRLSLLVQVSAAFLAMLPWAWGLEHFRFEPTPGLLWSLAWVVVVNSCSGLLLYLWLIGRGAAGKVASLFYLVPPVTAVMAAVALGTHFTLLDGAGFLLAAAGVWIGQNA